MNIRHAARAGTFYEASPASCEHHAIRLIESAAPPEDLPAKLYGGLVPHAGWMYSGHLAALTFNSLGARGALETVILLGADHIGTVRKGEVFDSGVWRTPLGEVAVDQELAAAILAGGGPLRANPQAHDHEHSLEVQVPLLQIVSPKVRIVPIGVPPTEMAVEIGQAIGRIVAGQGSRNITIVGSTDLTHHAGHFPAPGGHGKAGADWSTRNDRRMIDLILAMEAEKIVPEALEHGNACGAGAIAAAIAACRELGATQGLLLEYTNSYDVIHAMVPNEQDDTTVGYASIVFA